MKSQYFCFEEITSKLEKSPFFMFFLNKSTFHRVHTSAHCSDTAQNIGIYILYNILNKKTRQGHTMGRIVISNLPVFTIKITHEKLVILITCSCHFFHILKNEKNIPFIPKWIQELILYLYQTT